MKFMGAGGTRPEREGLVRGGRDSSGGRAGAGAKPRLYRVHQFTNKIPHIMRDSIVF
jgi:hypothetical protein